VIRILAAVWRSFPGTRRSSVLITGEPYAGLVRFEPADVPQRLGARPGSEPTGLLARTGPDAGSWPPTARSSLDRSGASATV
jgi:hypothetical protein